MKNKILMADEGYGSPM